MGYKVRRGSHAILAAIVTSFNALREALVGTNVHADTTPDGDIDDFNNPEFTALAADTTDATDLATGIAKFTDLKTVLNTHYADTDAHDSATSTAISTATPTDEASLVTAANALKTSYEAHRVASNVHFNNDTTNTISSADATDQASALTLLNELDGDVNAHILSALAGGHIQLFGP